MTEPVMLDSVIELYITNECNLTCSDCNRYNNYDFSGHHDWRESEQAIMAWGRRIQAPVITIIGGEPALHPDLIGWVDLAVRAWPGIPITIQTNGTVGHVQLERVKSTWGTKVAVIVSLHADRMHGYYKKNKYFLHSYQNDGDSDRLFWLEDQTQFTKCALRDQGQSFTVHDSDPDQAFESCTMKHSHTIFQGRLYKCPMVAILPRFAEQFQVDLSMEQQKLLMSYPSLASDCAQDLLAEFVATQNSAISQCRLCPAEYQTSTVTFDPARKYRVKLHQELIK